jgi:hypothetical protein
VYTTAYSVHSYIAEHTMHKELNILKVGHICFGMEKLARALDQLSDEAFRGERSAPSIEESAECIAHSAPSTARICMSHSASQTVHSARHA